MDKKTILYSLEQIGLSDKESAVYFASLELGKGTAQEISKKSGIKRATVYVAIEFLMSAGLMSSVHEGKKQFFIGESPERLVDFIHKKEAELREKKDKAKELISDLKELHQKDEEPMVKYYNGKEGVAAMVKSLLSFNDNEEVWIAYPSDTVEKFFTKEELDEMKFVRINNTIQTRALYTRSREILKNDKVTKRIRLDSKEFPLPADIAVYGDKVRLASFINDAKGVVIKDKDIAQSIKTLFKLAWMQSQKFEN